MQFNYLTLLAFAAAAVAVVVPAAAPFEMDTFTDFNCTERVSTAGTCNGGCQPFADRHSFQVPGGGKHCVTVYRQANCTGVSERYQVQNECTGVRTPDEFVLSYRCSALDIFGACPF